MVNMDVFQAIKQRKSVREYTGEGIKEENVYKLLESTRLAPSAKNLQPFELIVITDPVMKEKMVSVCHGQMFVEDASLIIIGLIENSKWSEVDLTISLDHLSLEAVELGLGTCWIGSFDSEKIDEYIKIPEGYEPFIIMTVGHPDDDSHSPTKKAIEELVRWIEPEIEETEKIEDDEDVSEKKTEEETEESQDDKNKEKNRDSGSLFKDH